MHPGVGGVLLCHLNPKHTSQPLLDLPHWNEHYHLAFYCSATWVMTYWQTWVLRLQRLRTAALNQKSVIICIYRATLGCWVSKVGVINIDYNSSLHFYSYKCLYLRFLFLCYNIQWKYIYIKRLNSLGVKYMVLGYCNFYAFFFVFLQRGLIVIFSIGCALLLASFMGLIT